MLKRAAKITCRHAHELMSERMDHPLPFWAEVRLQLHLRVCAACSKVEEQIAFLRKAVRRLGE